MEMDGLSTATLAIRSRFQDATTPDRHVEHRHFDSLFSTPLPQGMLNLVPMQTESTRLSIPGKDNSPHAEHVWASGIVRSIIPEGRRAIDREDRLRDRPRRARRDPV